MLGGAIKAGKIGSKLRNVNVGSKVSSFAKGGSSILKTSGGSLVGGAGAGYGVATLENMLGEQGDNKQLLVVGGAVLLVMYSAGQLFDIQLGD